LVPRNPAIPKLAVTVIELFSKTSFLASNCLRILNVYLKERDQRLQKFIHVTDFEDFCGTVERLIARQHKIFV